VSMVRNGEELGVRISGLHLSTTRQWFFAVSGESESVALVRLVV
jgi:hypothetical protein